MLKLGSAGSCWHRVPIAFSCGAKCRVKYMTRPSPLLLARQRRNHHLIRCHRCCRCHWLRRRPPKHSRSSTAGVPWPDAPVPRAPTAARDLRPGGRTSTGGRTPWSGADAVTVAGAHCLPRAAEPQVWRQVRVAAAAHMAAREPASLLPALASRA